MDSNWRSVQLGSLELIDLATQFAIQPHGQRTIARYIGPRDPESIHALYISIRRAGWRGMLGMNFGGDGGVTDITFTDDKRLVEK